MWFAKNGDKLFASITTVSGFLAAAQTPAALTHYAAWFTVASGIATLLHTIWFPNTTPPAAS